MVKIPNEAVLSFSSKDQPLAEKIRLCLKNPPISPFIKGGLRGIYTSRSAGLKIYQRL